MKLKSKPVELYNLRDLLDFGEKYIEKYGTGMNLPDKLVLGYDDGTEEVLNMKPEFKVGDRVRYRSGKVIWKIERLVESDGFKWARLCRQTRHLNAYFEDLKLVESI
jgi:hypothetical protein